VSVASIRQVENTHFRVHKHFLVTYSSVFRDLLQRQPGSSNTNDKEKRNETDHIIHLDGVTVLEFESLLTFFYEGYGNVHCTCSIYVLQYHSDF
jgi:hypothetical protein